MYDALVNSLHAISQALLVPVIVILLGLICYAIYQVGTLISESVSEHRHFDPAVTDVLNRLDEASDAEVPDVISLSSLLKRQKLALLDVWENRHLSEDAVFALAKRHIGGERARYDAVVSRTDLGSRLGPMIGLMGTLIPLGPGIVALSTGDTLTLSQALLVAFDTTVAGLVSAGIFLVISRQRRKWYQVYMQSLEAVMSALIDRIEAGRGEYDFDDSDSTARMRSLGDVVADAAAYRMPGGPQGAPAGDAGLGMEAR